MTEPPHDPSPVDARTAPAPVDSPGPDAPGVAGEEGARLRATLALTAAGTVANTVWLYVSVRDAELQAAILAIIGVLACTLPAFLCARRLWHDRPPSSDS